MKALKGRIDHVFHLAAVYDLSADAESQVRVNIEGTRNIWSSSPRRWTPGMCTTSAASPPPACTKGVFREDMFDEAENLDHPYFMTKHESEKIVRKECKVPWTVYRPACGRRQQTGEMDKIDGPYYFFKLIQRMRQMLPPWMPRWAWRRAHQHRAGGLRGRCDRPHQPRQGRPGRQVLPPGGPAWATASATCWTSSARPRTRPR
jgi:nucleoside-diphosphate-sugar epimerase